jgi:single-strand DNA-binding protein
MNNVVLIGRLTKDPELRYIPESQNAVATFTIAVDRPFAKEKQADFIRITVFGKQAENCERFLTKGRMVGIQGRLQTGSYKNKEGATVYTTDVVADRVEFLEWGDATDHKKNADEAFQQAPEAPDGFAYLDDDEPY